jgi:hypothetical protein
LVDKGQKAPSCPSSAAVREVNRLCRTAVAELALAQRDFRQHEESGHLNDLLAGGHVLLDQREPPTLARLQRLVVAGFPRHSARPVPFLVNELHHGI